MILFCMEIEKLNEILGEKLKDQERNKIFKELFGFPRWFATIPLLAFWFLGFFYILSFFLKQ